MSATRREREARLYALVTKQGTACSETVLTEEEYTEANRASVEYSCCNGGWDDPLPGTWVDVSDNEACRYVQEED